MTASSRYGLAPQGRQAQAMRRGYVRDFGTGFGPLFDMVADPSRLPEEDVRSVSNSGFGFLRERAESLRNERLTATPARQIEIEELLRRLDAFTTALRETVERSSNLQSLNKTQERLGIDRQVALVKASPLYRGTQSGIEDIQGSFDSDIQKVDSAEGIGAERRVAMLDAAKERASG